jgi:hypothetical protein
MDISDTTDIMDILEIMDTVASWTSQPPCVGVFFHFNIP